MLDLADKDLGPSWPVGAHVERVGKSGATTQAILRWKQRTSAIGAKPPSFQFLICFLGLLPRGLRAIVLHEDKGGVVSQNDFMIFMEDTGLLRQFWCVWSILRSLHRSSRLNFSRLFKLTATKPRVIC